MLVYRRVEKLKEARGCKGWSIAACGAVVVAVFFRAFVRPMILMRVLIILKSVLEYDVTLIEALDRGKAHCNHSSRHRWCISACFLPCRSLLGNVSDTKDISFIQKKR